MTIVKIKKLHPDAILPKYAHGPQEDAGMDLCSIEDALLYPGEPVLVKTGIAIELPPGYEAQIRPRSGLALKYNITIPNSPGTVDPSYRGELGIILRYDGASGWFRVNKGDRIAQMVVTRYSAVFCEVVDELAESERGEGGYGSTGLKAA